MKHVGWLRDALNSERRRHRAESEMASRNARCGGLAAEWAVLSECEAACAEVYERKLKELETKDG